MNPADIELSGNPEYPIVLTTEAGDIPLTITEAEALYCQLYTLIKSLGENK